MSSIKELQELEKDIQSRIKYYHDNDKEVASLHQQLGGIQDTIAAKEAAREKRLAKSKKASQATEPAIPKRKRGEEDASAEGAAKPESKKRKTAPEPKKKKAVSRPQKPTKKDDLAGAIHPTAKSKIVKLPFVDWAILTQRPTPPTSVIEAIAKSQSPYNPAPLPESTPKAQSPTSPKPIIGGTPKPRSPYSLPPNSESTPKPHPPTPPASNIESISPASNFEKLQPPSLFTIAHPGTLTPEEAIVRLMLLLSKDQQLEYMHHIKRFIQEEWSEIELNNAMAALLSDYQRRILHNRYMMKARVMRPGHVHDYELYEVGY
ncbi:hypothetical protein EJ08DRAFT_122011 [Tothia fuscella]|uniref:Uncharacterized protein n=1 Tax=Tothia fuscella TaxID=1048955 RepID=A0A9P4U126_9PEZI|nr:hypothetical protein EJ08DRAFT_122011 [Tothia fuscella]